MRRAAGRWAEEDGDLYGLAKSEARVSKERGMRRRRLKRLWKRLGELQRQKVSYENLLLKIGAAKGEAGKAAGLVELVLPEPPPTKSNRKELATFSFSLNKEALRQARRREGRYLLRSNVADD